MSNREMCVKLLDSVPEYKLDCVLAYIQGLLAYETPNAETVTALEEAEQMRAHPEQYKRYSSFDELLGEVLGDA